MRHAKPLRCRLGFHRFVERYRRDWAHGSYMTVYLHCYSCGKSR